MIQFLLKLEHHVRQKSNLKSVKLLKVAFTLSTCKYSDFSLGQDHLLPEAEEITMISIQLAARFLFTTGFHTKKIVRGPASDWYFVF